MMTLLEFLEKERVLVEQYEKELHELRMDYVDHNKEFEVGDYVHSRTNRKIIKINDIKYTINMGELLIMYCGFEYVYLQGQLLQNEYQKITCLTDNLDKIK